MSRINNIVNEVFEDFKEQVEEESGNEISEYTEDVVKSLIRNHECIEDDSIIIVNNGASFTIECKSCNEILFSSDDIDD